MKKGMRIISILTFFMLIITRGGLIYAKDVSEESKKVYLTFDDGPTYKITNKILDVLKEHKVKATFFIVGKEIEGKENILGRIFDEGHGIGVHTYSHNLKRIYRSEESFVNENIKTAEKIKDITGFYPSALRFPGGSSKRLSYSLLQKLHDNNFKIYDWNVSLEDGNHPSQNVQSLYAHSLKIKGDKNNVIILMHCNFNNINTIRALPRIIEEYKLEGYTFEAITDETKEYFYKIKK